MHRTVVLLSILLLVVKWADAETGVGVGQAAPDFVLPSLQGPPHRLSEWRGRPVILGYWAFWCWTWKDVDRGFRELTQGKPHPAYELVTVDIDCQWREQIRPLLDKGDMPYVPLMDPESRVSQAWGVKVVPTILVIDASGKVRARYEGYPGTKALRGWLDRFAALGLPQGPDGIVTDEWVRSQKRHPVDDGLADQHAIERILMQAGKSLYL